MSLNRTTVVLVLAAVVAVAGLSAYAVMNSNGADVTVYTDDGVSVSKSGDIFGNTTLTASVDSGKEFMGWYDENNSLISTSSKITAKLSNGYKIFAFTKNYVTEDGTGQYDLKTILNVSGSGTFSVGKSDYDSSQPSLDGTTAEFTSMGVYNVTYVDGSTHKCWHVLIDGTKTCKFNWELNQTIWKEWYTYSLSIDVTYSDYVHYRSLYLGDRASYYLNNGTSDSSIKHDMSYINYDTTQDKYIKQIADYITSNTSEMSEQEKAQVILEFTQYIEYKYDKDVHGVDEYWQFPLETLFLGSGDCEDTSILFCTVAKYLEYETSLFYFEGHMAPGVYLDDFTKPRARSDTKDNVYGWELKTSASATEKTPFYYGETTSTGWQIGQIKTSIYDTFKVGFAVSLYT